MTMSDTQAAVCVKERIIERAWRDPAFRAALAADPKAALRHAFGLWIPDETELAVIAETPRRLAIVIPPNPAAMAENQEKTDDTW
ncbi:NHLP leader peptide family RiPP precursor [Paenibacillus sp. MWE-103]|uniref:NHLP leader peptide family RiPP n=1 Tax=Paenibacillus artemisiicola TaxID=1172618 RepID=A0ABS3W4V8_9BACL|nr:NHLP leader peptide family RiPP precursor [Paenibacillus artemisiicola]MBO7743346.1 NHLP leader peptide family RiPP precursor [Paenibacillus artemisiicola]